MNRKWISVGVAVLAVAALGSHFEGAGAESGKREAVPARLPTAVALTPADTRDFAETVSTEGSLNARFYALVAPRVDGLLDAIPVREGDAVEAGKTLLFRADDVNRSQLVELARQELATARTSLEEKKAQCDINAADLSQARRDLERSLSLHEKGVITQAAREKDETALERLTAQERLDVATLALAEQTLEKARINLAIAEKDLRDSSMFAPIDGVVSKRFVEPGEMGSVGTPVVRIDDPKQLKAVAFLPGQYYSRVKVGTTRLVVRVQGKEIGRFPVSYRAPTIDAAYRTFEVWAYLDGDGEYAVPGAQASIEAVLEERSGVSVPRDALQRREGKVWVFMADGGKARRVEVTPGLDSSDWVEVVDAAFAAGAPIVTQGQFLLADGDPIREMREMSAAAP